MDFIIIINKNSNKLKHVANISVRGRLLGRRAAIFVTANSY